MKINAKTKLCCLIGNPVEHSLSPAIHNACYEKLKLNFVYLAFKVEDLKKAVEGIKALGVRGVSVTIPHKVKIISYLDEVDKTALEIGAVNTVLNEEGKLIGYNTDSEGAIIALKEVVGELRGRKVVIVGAGGAARAIAFGLKKEKAKILVLNRTVEKASELAKKIGAEFGGLNDLKRIKKADILINATPVGMSPKTDLTPVSKEYLHSHLTVFDIVYNPKETRLIKIAKELGCRIVYGYKMLLYQAVEQFKLFTGKNPPVEVMEEVLVKNLGY